MERGGGGGGDGGGVGEIIGLELDRCWPPWGYCEGGLSEPEVGVSERGGWARRGRMMRRLGEDMELIARCGHGCWRNHTTHCVLAFLFLLRCNIL